MRLIDADKLLDRLPKVDLDHDEKITRSGAIMDMICMVETAPTVEVPRWIPVTERMPGYHKRVLVYVAQFTCEKVTYINTTVMAYLIDIGFICCEYGELLRGVAHWMPLPEPPEVE